MPPAINSTGRGATRGIRPTSDGASAYPRRLGRPVARRRRRHAREAPAPRPGARPSVVWRRRRRRRAAGVAGGGLEQDLGAERDAEAGDALGIDVGPPAQPAAGGGYGRLGVVSESV